jgi:WS/DGAT/MGAT family acyltransferase
VREELSAADRSALTAERGSINMAVGGLLILEAGGELTRAMVAERFASRIHLVERLRQRLEEPPLGIASPVWTDDTNFDIDWHVRQAVLPAPGDEEELGLFVGREFSHRLDRSRPLWEVTLLEGLADGRRALLLKAHHALADGMAAIALGALLLDPTPEPLEIPPPAGDWSPQPYNIRRHAYRVASAPLSWATRPMVDGMLRALDPSPRRAAADALKAAQDLRKATDVALELVRTRPIAPMLPLNRPISANRRYAIVDADLATVRRVGKLAGGTVNDTLLAVVTGALARYLQVAAENDRAAGVEPAPLPRPPVALVPVSVRTEEPGGALGNRISTVFVDLPVDERDLLRRITLIGAQMRDLKDSPAIRAGEIMVGFSGYAPPLISGLIGRAMGSVRAFNIVVSNVPGPPQPLYMHGIRATAIHPVAPLNPANQGLNVGILSYNGRVCFGLLADRDLDPSLRVATEGLHAALAELRGLAE